MIATAFLFGALLGLLVGLTCRTVSLAHLRDAARAEARLRQDVLARIAGQVAR